MSKAEVINIFGDKIEACCHDPVTGYFRDGFCNTDEHDFGSHVVCAEITEDFLIFSKAMGNDLSTPRPEFNFPGLKEGDRWCLCALRWKEGLLNPIYRCIPSIAAVSYTHLTLPTIGDV